MILFAYALLAAATSGRAPEQFAQLTIRQRVVIRIPATPLVAPPPQRRIEWKEKKGPKCVPMGALAGAVLMRADTIDIVLRGGQRLRAELDDECPAIDYYNGFYILPTADGQMCADRDAIHARSGGQCGIERFRALVPPKP